MIYRSHELPLFGQAKALGISRGSVYYLARPTSDADLALMRRIDELHLERPFAGSRMLRGMLKAEGREAGLRAASRFHSAGRPATGYVGLNSKVAGSLISRRRNQSPWQARSVSMRAPAR